MANRTNIDRRLTGNLERDSEEQNISEKQAQRKEIGTAEQDGHNIRQVHGAYTSDQLANFRHPAMVRLPSS